MRIITLTSECEWDGLVFRQLRAMWDVLGTAKERTYNVTGVIMTYDMWNVGPIYIECVRIVGETTRDFVVRIRYDDRSSFEETYTLQK